MDINRMVVSNKLSFDNKILNNSLVPKIIQEYDLYAYSF